MPVSLYRVTIPVFIKHLTTLSSLLTKATAFAPTPAAQETLLATRLVPDMANLVYQIQRVSDTAKGVTTRVAGMEPVPMEDNEVTFDDLQSRLQKTIDVLKGAKEDMFDGKETAEVVLKTRGGEQVFTGETYVLNFAIPNFYFHFVTAYDILRHKGVPIGKSDYLQNP